MKNKKRVFGWGIIIMITVVNIGLCFSNLSRVENGGYGEITRDRVRRRIEARLAESALLGESGGSSVEAEGTEGAEEIKNVEETEKAGETERAGETKVAGEAESVEETERAGETEGAGEAEEAGREEADKADEKLREQLIKEGYLVYRGWTEMEEDLDLPYADAEAFRFVKDAYADIEFGGDITSGDMAFYDEYREIFRELIYNRAPFIDRETGEEIFLKDFDGLKFDWEMNYYVYSYVYHFFDMDGDARPELGIRNKREHNAEYIFKYLPEKKQFILWYTMWNGYYEITGSKKMLWLGNYQHLAFYQLGDDGEVECETFFTNGNYNSEVGPYLVMLPVYANRELETDVPEEIKRQGIYVISDKQWYFRVTSEQYKKLTAPYIEASNRADKAIEQVTYTYEELFEGCAISFSGKTYEYHSENMSATLHYPQITGIGDTEKEKRINQLIDDIAKVVELDTPDEYGRILDIGVRWYEIKYASEQIISIAYSGWEGRLAAGSGLPATMFTTTIDIEAEKVLELEDVICDMDGLYEQLKDDRFKHITAWEGETGYYKITTDFYSDEDLKEALLSGKMEWYVDGKNFVVVDLEYQGGGVGYNEYARDMKRLDGIIDKDFRQKIGLLS
ncbi:MAG: hypothetical protein NC092_10060 [Butyrivibrio sp.]|nr:hypothetical protein [Muribaculum sp.]MCM1553023.1 hypothetical protein [Butyrivibrio sp.]